MNLLPAFERFVDIANQFLGHILVPALLFTGVLLTVRLGFIQLRKVWHGTKVTFGVYDDENDDGDVSHFQALSTALSATIGVGNIAGVAMAIHWGGPGALFWMWVTGFLGMALKYAECTLALAYRQVNNDPEASEQISGGPMYYMRDGLGSNGLATLYAGCVFLTTLVSGSAVQSNSFAHAMNASFGLPYALTGLIGALFVAAVILGGIKRIGKVASVLTPVMAFTYVFFALAVLFFYSDQVLPAFARVFTEAFNPVAGVTGAGTASFLMMMQTGVRRALYSSEAGTGSASIAHAAAKTDEPVSEGSVALLEPFIDTLVVCSLTGLVLITTNVWDERHRQEIAPSALVATVETSVVTNGISSPVVHLHDCPVGDLYLDPGGDTPFNGTLVAQRGRLQALDETGSPVAVLYGDAVQVGAPLTALAFQRGLAPWGDWGGFVVALCVGLFAISTALGVSYYGDRCAQFLFGQRAVLPFRIAYCIMYFVGAVSAVPLLWKVVDMAFAIATLPNVLALILLSGTVKKLTDSYFRRKPWEKR